MDQGSYTKRRVDFTPFAASFFNPHLYTGSARSRVGCGATALSLLTGHPPEEIAAKRKAAHYSDEFMLRFLAKNGFRTLRLTLCNVSSADHEIGPEYVILLSQLFQKNEGTWGVIFRSNYFHNFALYTLDSLSFVNKPILSAYLVLHPTWRIDRPKKTAKLKHLSKKACHFPP